ncbi:MAG: outer membrane beta-barrel protein [Armatimonadetes bacterium]|nr:outer membrane beta-barrel protein [Armatimonadota bacterium]
MKLWSVLILSAACTMAFAGQDWSTNATVDLYYQFGPGRLAGRGLDTKTNKLTLGSAVVRFKKTSSQKSPFGATIDLAGGDSIDLVNTLEPGGADKYKAVQQGYLTFSGKDVTVDLGKFNSWLGYEYTLPSDNLN